jgi:hypothetical protein
VELEVWLHVLIADFVSFVVSDPVTIVIVTSSASVALTYEVKFVPWCVHVFCILCNFGSDFVQFDPVPLWGSAVKLKVSI